MATPTPFHFWLESCLEDVRFAPALVTVLQLQELWTKVLSRLMELDTAKVQLTLKSLQEL